MSGKNFLQPFPVIISGDMSGDITSLITDTLKNDNLCYQVVWSGSALIGRFAADVTDDDPQGIASPVWTELIFDFSQSVPANSGDGIFNINQIPGRWIRFRYEATSGTGSLDVKVSGKGLG